MSNSGQSELEARKARTAEDRATVVADLQAEIDQLREQVAALSRGPTFSRISLELDHWKDDALESRRILRAHSRTAEIITEENARLQAALDECREALNKSDDAQEGHRL